MSLVTPTMSAEELIKLPRGKVRYELVKGELLAMSPTGSEHGLVTFRLSGILDQFLQKTKLGVAFGAETGFQIHRNPDTVRAPDIAFIRKERVPDGGFPQGYWSEAPDLAVEVVSPGDTVRAIDEKVADWLQAGATLVWVVSPRWRTVTVYPANGEIKMLAGDEVLEGGELLPGFRCAVSEIFATLPPLRTQ